MVRFIDDHRDVYGVESICATVPIAPSTYFLHKAQHADPRQRSARIGPLPRRGLAESSATAAEPDQERGEQSRDQEAGHNRQASRQRRGLIVNFPMPRSVEQAGFDAKTTPERQ